MGTACQQDRVSNGELPAMYLIEVVNEENLEKGSSVVGASHPEKRGV
jgi:hypothetical protein